MTALMVGRLVRSRLYHEQHVPEFSISCVDGPTAVAFDGEVDGQHQHASFTVRVIASAAAQLTKLIETDVGDANPRYATCSYTMPFSDDPAKPTRR
ncbi:MAG: hypothetical protein WB989_19785 [Mycobacterium sp.]